MAGEEGDTCRICYGEATPDEPLLTACGCKGSVSFVHESCVHAWIDRSGSWRCNLCLSWWRLPRNSEGCSLKEYFWLTMNTHSDLLHALRGAFRFAFAISVCLSMLMAIAGEKYSFRRFWWFVCVVNYFSAMWLWCMIWDNLPDLAIRQFYVYGYLPIMLANAAIFLSVLELMIPEKDLPLKGIPLVAGGVRLLPFMSGRLRFFLVATSMASPAVHTFFLLVWVVARDQYKSRVLGKPLEN